MDSVKDRETMELDCIPETNNNNEKQEVLSGKRSLEPRDTNCCREMEECTVVVSASRWCAGVRMWSTLYSVMTASLLSFILGTTLAYSSPTILEFTNPNNRYHFSTTISAIYAAASLVGSMFGSPLAGYVADRWGRKTCLAINVIPYLLGYFAILTTYLFVEDAIFFKVILVSGRFISGIGMGWSFVIVPIYIGEIAPAKTRGAYVIISEIFLSFGIVMIFALGSIPDFHYYDIAVFLIAVMAIFMVLFPWIPETPRWLILGLKERPQAMAVLKYLRGPKNKREIITELAGIESSIVQNKIGFFQVLAQISSDGDILYSFLIALFVVIYHQLNGVGVLSAYSGTIFEEAGAPNPDLVSVFSAGFCFLLATIVSAGLVEVLGRKILLSISAAGICTSQAAMGLHAYLTLSSLCDNSTSKMTDSGVEQCNFHLFPLAIAGVVVMSLSFGIGAGPIPWIFLSEYLPLQVRGIAGGIIILANRGTAVLITGTFLHYRNLVNPWFSWWTLSLLNLVCFVLIVVFVVETKGKTLEEVQKLFKTRTSTCKRLGCKR